MRYDSLNDAPPGALANTQNWVYGDNQPRPNFTRGRPEPLPRQKLLGHNGYTEFREKPPEAPQPPKYTEKVTNPNVGTKGSPKESAEAKKFREGYSNQSMQGDPSKYKPAQPAYPNSSAADSDVKRYNANFSGEYKTSTPTPAAPNAGIVGKSVNAAGNGLRRVGAGALNMGTATRNFAGRAAPYAAAIEAANDVYNTIQDPNATTTDKFTAGAEGIAKGAAGFVGSVRGGLIGARRGWKGALAGSVAGGAAGSALATGAIKGLRGISGLDTELVTERTARSYPTQPAAQIQNNLTAEQPAQKANLRDPYAEANAAKIAALSGTNPELSTTQTAVKAGDRRNVDGFGNLLDPNTEQVYAGPGRGWETRSSEQGNRERLRKDQEYKELYARNYAEATKDGPGGVFGRQLRYAEEMKNQDYMNVLREKASLGDKRAAKQFKELSAVNATIEDARTTKQAGLRSQQLAEERLAQTARRDEYERDRNYKLDEFKARSEDNKVRAEEAAALRKDKADNYERRTGEVERKFGDDKAKQAEYMTFMDNFRVSKANAAKARGDMQSYQNLMREDYVMDAAAREELDMYWNVREEAKQNSGWRPGTGHFVDSLNPEDYFIEEIEDNRFGLGAGKAKLRNGSSVYVNDLYDKDLIGPKKDSRYDKVVDEARVRTKNKQAAREAALRMYQ